MLGWPLYSFLIPVLIPMLSFTSLVTKPNQYSELLLYQRRADVENTCYDLLQGITSTYHHLLGPTFLLSALIVFHNRN